MSPENIDTDTNRARVAEYIRSLDENGLMDLLGQYGEKIRPPDYSDDDLGAYKFEEMRCYPQMSMEEEMAAGRILELNKDKPTDNPSVKMAKEFLVGSQLLKVWHISRRFGWVKGYSSRLTRDDLYQVGVATLVSCLSNWPWEEVPLGVYTYKPVTREMAKEIRRDRGLSAKVSVTMFLLRHVRDLWAQLHPNDNPPDNETLANAMFLYHNQPDLKLNEPHASLAESLIALGEKLNVFEEVRKQGRKPRILSLEERIKVATERMDLCDEMAREVNEIEGNKGIRQGEDDGKILFDLLSESDIYFRLDLEELKGRIESVLLGIKNPQRQKALRFMLLGMLDGDKPTIPKLAEELGVKVTTARSIYESALRDFSRQPNFRKLVLDLVDRMD